jgi:hypothetical protein
MDCGAVGDLRQALMEDFNVPWERGARSTLVVILSSYRFAGHVSLIQS